MVRTERTYWTAEEDQRLVEQVQQHGTNKWVVIASNFEGKDNKSCSHRYNNYLDPLLNKSPFSPWEDSVVSQLYKEVGPRWKYIAKCLSGSQGRRSANTVKNRYQALKKYWVHLETEAPQGAQEPGGSEEEEGREAPPQLPQLPQPDINVANMAVRADFPGAAVNTSQPSPFEPLGGLDQIQFPMPQLQDNRGREDPSSLATGVANPNLLQTITMNADGALSHKFMVLQSRLHKASQLLAGEESEMQAWEHDRQKIHSHLDSIKTILDTRMLSLIQSAPPPMLPPPVSEPAIVPPPVSAAPAVAPALAVAQPTPPSPQPSPQPKPQNPQNLQNPQNPPNPKTGEKVSDAKSEPSTTSAASGAEKRTAEGLKKTGKELNNESSEMDVACILNDLAKANKDNGGGTPQEKKATPPAQEASPSQWPAKKRVKPSGSPLTS